MLLAYSRSGRRGAFGAEACVKGPGAASSRICRCAPSRATLSLAPAADVAKYAAEHRVVTSGARPVNVGLIGLGTVGSQVGERMLSWQTQLSRRAGVELCLRRVLVRDLGKRRTIEIEPDLLTAEPADVLEDPAIGVLIEGAGGDERRRRCCGRAVRAGRWRCTG